MANRRTKIILGLDAGPYVRGLAKASTATKAFVKDLDSSDSRMGNLVQTSLALGPALVPIGAAAVPAVAALTAGLGAAAGAAAVAGLAFSGIGDGLGALNDYQLEPTAENLEKVKQAFEDLGPAGSNFVLFLDEIEPKLDKLQNTARAGLLPGVQEGIEHLLERGPQANRIIGEIADTLGDLAAEGGEGLAGPKFEAFFDYIEREARPILTDMARTAGNVAEGLANMLVGFGPASTDFSSILLDLSRDFAEWSRGLEDNRGFQEFLDYVRRVSPKALDTIGAVAVALGDIVAAAAPVGEVTLPIIKAVAETLSTIAESPAGPVLIAAAAGVSAVSRAVALYNVANGSALVGMLGGVERKGRHAKGAAEGLGAGFRAAAAGAGVFALSMTDVDDNLGVSNTAMGVAIGTLGGPWGAAIGGAIGGAIDFANRNDDVAASLEAINEAAENPTNLVKLGKTIDDTLEDIHSKLSDVEHPDTILGGVIDPRDAFSNVAEAITGDLHDLQREAKQADIDYNRLLTTVSAFRNDVKGKGTSGYTQDVQKLTHFLERAKPALDQAGISVKSLEKAQEDGSREWLHAVDVVRKYNKENDSIPGRVKGVRNALNSLDDVTYSAAQSASKLDAALSSLLDPELDAREALIAWKQGLVDLRKQIRGTTGTLDLNTKAGRDNQTAIISQIRSLKEVAVAQAKQDGNTKRATKTLRDGRKAIIEAGVQSGISADKMRRLVNQMGLVPEIVQPKVSAPGINKTIDDFEDLWGSIFKVPDKKDVKTDAPGGRETRSLMHDLLDDVNDVPDKKDVKTDAPGADKTRGQMQGLKGDIDKLQGKTVDVTLSTKASKIIGNVAEKIGDSFTSIFADGAVVEEFANGGMRENHVAQIARPGAWRVWAEDETGGESYIPLAPSKRGRSLDIWHETGRRLGVEGYADGGVLVGTGGNDPSKPLRRIDAMYDEVAAALGDGLGKVLSKALLSLGGGGFHWPVPRQYGYTGTWGSYSSGGSHPALDFPAPIGTDIFSVLPGRVTGTTSLGDRSYGNYTEISHGHGISSLYAHQSAFRTHPGAVVDSGDHIGEVGDVGNTTGPHLHLELKRDGVSFDYTSWLKGGGPAWTQGGSVNGAVGPGASAAKKYAASQMGRYGWSPDQMRALLPLWDHESGWNYQADNPSSSAYGIPQGLVALHNIPRPYWQVALGNDNYRGGDPQTQIDWGLRYIKDAYGSPSSAWGHWQSAGSYADGGINVFDGGGRWPSGTLGVNLSGRDEYVNDPNATAAAIHMANGGLIGPLSSDNSGSSNGNGRIGRLTGRDDFTIRIPPGAIRSFKDLLEMVSKPDVHRNIGDLNDAWRTMRNETAKLNREERQLDRIRNRSKSSAKAVRESEKKLEDLRTERDKSTAKRQRIEDKLKDVRREGGDELKDLDKAERALIRVRQEASKNGKISKSEQKEITQAEDELRRKRQHASDATRKANKIEAQLLKARRAETVDDKQVHRLRERLHNQREREKITAKDLAKQEKDVTDQREQLNKATEKWKALQKQLIEQARAVADAITQQGDVFGGAGTSNTAQGLLSKLQGASGDAENYGKLLKRAKRRGVDQDILDQILDQGSTPESLNLLQSLSHAPDSLINKINRQQERLDRIANQVGTWTIRGDGHHHGGGGHAGRGRSVVQNFNGPISTTDIKGLGRELEHRWRKGLIVAKGP